MTLSPKLNAVLLQFLYHFKFPKFNVRVQCSFQNFAHTFATWKAYSLFFVTKRVGIEAKLSPICWLQFIGYYWIRSVDIRRLLFSGLGLTSWLVCVNSMRRFQGLFGDLTLNGIVWALNSARIVAVERSV